MKIAKFYSLSICAILLLTFTAYAQPKREVLTNDKVVELSKLGLGDEIVVAKIRQSECRCDTSMAALQKLKAAGVSQKVIMAMLDTTAGFSDSPGAAVSPKVVTAAAPSDSLLRDISEPGIYIVDNGQTTFIEPSVFSASKTGGWSSALTYGIKKSKVRAVLRGASANTQIVNNRPEFYFVFSLAHRDSAAVMSGFGGYNATSPNEFVLLAMRMKDKTREVTLGEFGMGQVSTGVKDGEVREFSFEKIKPGVYKVVPKTDLALGEYCFHYAGSATGTKVFDFSIKPVRAL